jgi:dTDP-L-rhamnose 4-epimerase
MSSSPTFGVPNETYILPQLHANRPSSQDQSLVLVTGGAGFIGSHLVRRLLAGGYRVRVLDNLSPQIHGDPPAGLDWLSESEIDFIRGSVTSEDDVRTAITGVDAIIHLAAETGTGQSMYEIARYTQVNLQGTAVILDALANTQNHNVKKVVLASSRSVYGEGAYICAQCAPHTRVSPPSRDPSDLAANKWEPVCSKCHGNLTTVPTIETDPTLPASIYAATKLGQEDLVRIACSSLRIGYVILRLQNVYGEGQSLKNPYTGILSIFSTRIRRGLPLPIFEDGLETRDFVHVQDVTAAFLSALQMKVSSETINVGSGKRTTIIDMARKLTEAFGKDPQIVVTGQYRIGDIRHNCADITALRERLNREPEINLETGLQRFADWTKTQSLPDDGLERANAEMKTKGLMR